MLLIIILGGDPKPLHFSAVVANGTLDEFADVLRTRLLYVRQGQFPEGAVKDGWAADG